MLWSWGILRLAASSFCCDLTSFLTSKLAASQKKLILTARNSSFWLFLGSKNLTTSFKIWIAQHSVVVEQSCKWQKYSRVRHQFKSASTFDLGCVTFLGRVTKNDVTIASDRRKYWYYWVGRTPPQLTVPPYYFVQGGPTTFWAKGSL